MKKHVSHPHHDVIVYINEEMSLEEIGDQLVLIGERLKSGSVELNGTRIAPKNPIELEIQYETHHNGSHKFKLDMIWRENRSQIKSNKKLIIK